MEFNVAKSQEALLDSKKCFRERHFVTLMLFLGMANAYIMRTNMSIAIVAMVNHTAILKDVVIPPTENICESQNSSSSNDTSAENHHKDGQFVWDSVQQSTILTAFFYGYVVTQIPFGLLAKKYGSIKFLGYGMLINSVFGLFVPIAAQYGIVVLSIIRFIQGLGEGPIVPCTHAILAKWIPPNERSRMGAFVYAGAQFGTVIALPVSGFLAEYGFSGGWPSIFYIFGLIGAIWSIAFIFAVYESPNDHPNINEKERDHINTSVWGTGEIAVQSIPFKEVVTSAPFWAILIAHMAHNYSYETLLTQLPTFMQQILHFDIKSNGINSAMPYFAMWIFSGFFSIFADAIISSKKCTITTARKIINAIGQYGAAVALILAAYTGCSQFLTVTILTIGMGLNGAIYSGFKVNHLDLSPSYAGILMSFTNCSANFAGLIAPNVAGLIIHKRPTQAAWRIVFFIAAAINIIGSTVFIIFASGEQQPWDKENEKSRIKKNNNKSIDQEESTTCT